MSVVQFLKMCEFIKNYMLQDLGGLNYNKIFWTFTFTLSLRKYVFTTLVRGAIVAYFMEVEKCLKSWDESGWKKNYNQQAKRFEDLPLLLERCTENRKPITTEQFIAWGEIENCNLISYLTEVVDNGYLFTKRTK